MAPRLVSLLLAVLVASACATPAEREPLPVSPLTLSGSERLAIDEVVVVTDASLSVLRGGAFPDAKALTRSFIASMPPADTGSGYAAGMIGFGGPIRETTPMSQQDRTFLARTAAELDPLGGNTPLDRVLTEAGTKLSARGNAAMVVFSDGRPNSEEKALASARALVAEREGRLCIHTVQVGGEPEGAAFLGELARVSGCGSFRAASEVETAALLSGFTRIVFVEEGLPPVAAARGTDPCSETITLGEVHFDFDRDQVTPAGSATLSDVAVRLGECPEVKLSIEGHTDAIGTELYNQDLSERRAGSARGFLVGSGVDGGRLAPRGFGETSPVAGNDTAEGRARNRRVELVPR